MLKNKKMFDKLKGTISQFLPTIIAGLILFGIGIVLAGNWHSPTDNPPEGNVPQPLNVGGEWQAKDAPIGFNSVGSGHAGSVPTTRWIGNEGGTLYISAGTKWNTKQQLSIGMDGVITLLGDDKRITKVDDPIENDDVATKGWVLAQIGGGGGGDYNECKVICQKNNNPTCPSGFKKIACYGCGKGCAAYSRHFPRADIGCTIVHEIVDGKSRYNEICSSYTINIGGPSPVVSAAVGSVICKDNYLNEWSWADHDSGCAICCK